jgi:protease I
MKALILSANDFEDSELLVPYYRLQEAGYKVDVAAESRGVIRGMHGYEVQAVKGFLDVDPKEYAVLILPGGKAPAMVRKVQTALSIVRHFITGNKPVGAICHGPQILASAEVLHGRRATCYPKMAIELQEVGAFYEDSEVVVDGRLVTSRQPADIPAFMREVMKLLSLRGVCVPDEYWGDDASIPFEAATKARM